MKICYITAEYPPRTGGVGDYVQHLSREMAARGHGVTVVTSAGSGGTADADAVNPPRVLPVVKRWNLFHLPRLLKVLGAVGADVYVMEHVSYMYGRGGVAPWMLVFFSAFKLRNGKPLVLNAHEMWRPRYRSVKATVLSLISFVIFCCGIWASAKVVATNRFRESLLTGVMGVDRRRVGLIPVGANILPVSGWERRLDNARELRVATFGIWHEDRMVEELVAAVEELTAVRAVKLSIVGNFGNGEGSRALRRRLAGAPDSPDWLNVTGAVSAAEVSEYLARTDVYVSPLVAGPSGRRGSLVAAMAHGLPIIAYDGPERDEVFRDGDNIILVKEGDRTGLCEALATLAGDSARRRELGARARATFEDHFAWGVIADKWEALLATVV